MKTATAKLDDWIPIRIYNAADEPYVDWCHLGDARLTEPFFDGTIERRMRVPFNLAFRHQTPLRELEERYARGRSLAPSGLIFHVSRCGSTLIAQQLASLARHRVLSEAEPIDDVLRFAMPGRTISVEERATWLRWVVAGLGQPAGGEEALFIKHDGWHTLDIPVIRRAFPDTPCVFVYRDPLEVLVSQMNSRAMYLIPGVPGTEIFGVDPQAAMTMEPEAFCATVLAAIYGGMLRHARDPGVLLVNYRDLPQAIVGAIARHFNVHLTENEKTFLCAATEFHAKQPQFAFTPDSDEKQRTAGSALRFQCDRLLTPIYSQLEATRNEKAESASRRS